MEELDAVRNNLSGNYILGGDIDLSGVWASGEGWFPIGNFDAEGGYRGKFDGNGHTISNLTINRPEAEYQGLFGCLGHGAIVRNLNIVGGSVHGLRDVGGLAVSTGAKLQVFNGVKLQGPE